MSMIDGEYEEWDYSEDETDDMFADADADEELEDSDLEETIAYIHDPAKALCKLISHIDQFKSLEELSNFIDFHSEITDT